MAIEVVSGRRDRKGNEDGDKRDLRKKRWEREGRDDLRLNTRQWREEKINW